MSISFTDNFHIHNEEIEQLLRDLGIQLSDKMPAGWGFCLFLMDYDKGDNGATFYISNFKREDMIKALEEFIEKRKADK